MGLALRARAGADRCAGRPTRLVQEALELANKATFAQAELDAYEKVRDEIQQVHAIAEARWAEGEAAGFTKGEVAGFTKGETAGFTKGRDHRQESSRPRDPRGAQHSREHRSPCSY